MNSLDWIILFASQLLIVGYGIWRSRKNANTGDYYKGSGMGWLTVGISVMATQASAITFLSAPGQAFSDGMRFVQFYLGLPIAMIIISETAVPLYKKLNVYTAYEYLENRFNVKVRVLAALLFLLHRGLAAGFTIFAPSLVLSAVLGWDIVLCNIVIGSIVILYTVTGGTKAVAETQKIQMVIIMAGMFFAAYLMLNMLPEGIGLPETLQIAGKADRMNVLVTDFSWKDKYNVWSGLIGGCFLALSYFGTDQSQVSRYLTASSINKSRMGLLFNGIFKIPMQFSILLIGVVLYVFFLFNPMPLFFNPKSEEKAVSVLSEEEYVRFTQEFNATAEKRKTAAFSLHEALKSKDETRILTSAADFKKTETEVAETKKALNAAILEKDKSADLNETNYVFFHFVKEYLPVGMLGLIISVIFSASMSSTSSELNALSSSTSIDIYKRLFNPNATEAHYLRFSKATTLLWGVYAIIFACFANRLGSLIEAVNIIGSLVYGTILGIFLTGFYLKKVQSFAVLSGGLILQTGILMLYFFTEVPFLWYNVIGGLGVPLLAFLIQAFRKEKAAAG
ncbi:MAG: sodium:solute symporter [Flavobacteriales bacterium]|nr:sodium:solute symporter [Flavobacteriales bacterium]